MDHGNEAHITPKETYWKVYWILIFLTIVTVAFTKVNFGPFNTAVAMLIATGKAAFVVLIFMHQKYEKAINRVAFFSSFVFLLIMVFFTATDIWTRVTFLNERDFTKKVEAAEQTKTQNPSGAPTGTH